MWPAFMAWGAELQWAFQDRGLTYAEASIAGGFQPAQDIAQ